jgi:hypothetical protein
MNGRRLYVMPGVSGSGRESVGKGILAPAPESCAKVQILIAQASENWFPSGNKQHDLNYGI